MKTSFRFSQSRWLLGAVAVLLAAPTAQAQVDTYSFTAVASTFAPLPTTATNVNAIETDDAISGSLPIGFTFVYDGTPHTTFRASSNGFISFAASPGSNYNNDLSGGGNAERPLIAPLWSDLDGSMPGAAAKRQLTGTMPNRVLTMEWLNWEHLDFGSTGPSISFQVKLYETTNVVEMVYRREANTQTNFSSSIGLAGVGTGPGSFLSLSDAVANPTVSSVTSVDTIARVPPTGQLYRFTPPVPSACPTPRNLSATVSGTTATVRWAVSGGTGPFSVIYGPTGFNPATGGTTLPNVSSPATITGLTPGSYQFYVVQNCGGTAGNSNLSNPGGFNLPCPSPSALMAGTVTNTAAALTFVATPTPGGSFTVIYGPPGFVPGSGGTSVTGITGTSTTLTGLMANTAYQVYVQQVCAGGGTGAMLAGPVSIMTTLVAPANDDPCGALALGAAAVPTSNVGATTSLQPGIVLPGCAPSQAPKDVWFSFVAPATTTASLTITGTAAGQVRVFSSPSCANGPFSQVFCRAATGNNVGFSAPLLVPGLMPGTTYYVAVSGYGSADPAGSFSVQYAAAPLATQVLADTPALTVYPNPSPTGYLMLRLAAAGPGQATLHNALGQTVRSLALPGNNAEHRLPTTGLAAGLYTLQVRQGNAVLTRRVVLE